MGGCIQSIVKRILYSSARNALPGMLVTLFVMQFPGLLFSQDQTAVVVASERTVTRPPMDLPLSTWVGPGDVLRIKAFPDTGSFISGNYIILDNGFVMLPILDRIQVTHFSIPELTKHLTEAYSKILAYPIIQIEPLIRLSFIGGFLQPGMYLVNPLHPFSSALSAAGGTVRDDGLELLRWERDGKVLTRNLTSIVEGDKSLWALGFNSNDQICVTLRTRRDLLPVAGFIVSSILSSATLAITILVLMQ